MTDEDDIIICRCEDITKKDIEEAVALGYDTIEQLKRYLRLGMGPCQGRTCTKLAIGILRQMTGKSVDEIGSASERPPVVPVHLGDLAFDPEDYDEEKHLEGGE